MLDDARDHGKCGSRELLATSVHGVVTGLVVDREVHVEAATTLVVPWLPQEGRKEPILGGNVSHRGLQ